MSWNNPLMRLLAVVVAVAVGIRLVWLLLEPVLPALAVAAVAFGLWRLVSWWRSERW